MCVGCLFIASTVYAQITLLEVVAFGIAGDNGAALVDALENAIGQVCGLKLSSVTLISMSEVTKVNTITIEQDFTLTIFEL